MTIHTTHQELVIIGHLVTQEILHRDANSLTKCCILPIPFCNLISEEKSSKIGASRMPQHDVLIDDFFVEFAHSHPVDRGAISQCLLTAASLSMYRIFSSPANLCSFYLSTRSTTAGPNRHACSFYGSERQGGVGE